MSKIHLNKLNKVIASDIIYRCINYMGLIDHDKLTDIYKNADGFVFASSCENQPIILLEAMAAGLPIACSNKADAGGSWRCRDLF